MRLSKEQFEALQPYQQNFETMLRSQWARHPGNSAIDLMHDIYQDVTNTKTFLNKSCSHCVMKLIENMGKIYLADLKEMESVPETEESVPETEESAPKKSRSKKPRSNGDAKDKTH